MLMMLPMRRCLFECSLLRVVAHRVQYFPVTERSEKSKLSWLTDRPWEQMWTGTLTQGLKGKMKCSLASFSECLGLQAWSEDGWKVPAGQPFLHAILIRSQWWGLLRKPTCSSLSRSLQKDGAVISRSIIFQDKYPDLSPILGIVRVYPHFQWPRKRNRNYCYIPYECLVFDHSGLFAI